MSSEVLKVEQQGIVAYDEFRSQLAVLKEDNSKAVFDYADPDGNKEARSHIYKLRQAKTAVDKARQKEKSESLEYGRQVDREAKEIIGQIETMIAVHQKPIDEIENKEKERVVAHETAYMALATYEHVLDVDCHSDTIKMLIRELEAMEPDESYEEFTGAAIKAYKKSMSALESGLKQAEGREAEQAELAKLREEKETRDRKEREALIAKDATEKAEIAAREKVEQAEIEKQQAIEREAQAKRKTEERETQLKRDAEESERRRIEDAKLAEERAKKAVEEAEAKVKQDALDTARLESEAAEKREADKKHKAAVHKEATLALVNGGITKTAATKAITLIASRGIPNVSITY